MSTVSQVETNVVAGSYEATQAVSQSQKKSNVTGKTIGNPQLSEEGLKYYEELKKKYSNMEFILVSDDKKAEAKAQAAKYANPAKMVVLIDVSKVERMAVDETYRNQYENIINNASAQMPQFQSELAKSPAEVKGFGMQINDNGTASYFAVIDKSLATQKERIEEKRAEKKAAKKEAAEEAAEEAALEKRAERKASKNSEEPEELVTITASSVEELLQKIDDYVYAEMSDCVQTDAEKMVGQHIDFRL